MVWCLFPLPWCQIRVSVSEWRICFAFSEEAIAFTYPRIWFLLWLLRDAVSMSITAMDFLEGKQSPATCCIHSSQPQVECFASILHSSNRKCLQRKSSHCECHIYFVFWSSVIYGLLSNFFLRQRQLVPLLLLQLLSVYTAAAAAATTFPSLYVHILIFCRSIMQPHLSLVHRNFSGITPVGTSWALNIFEYYSVRCLNLVTALTYY